METNFYLCMGVKVLPSELILISIEENLLPWELMEALRGGSTLNNCHMWETVQGAVR